MSFQYNLGVPPGISMSDIASVAFGEASASPFLFSYAIAYHRLSKPGTANREGNLNRYKPIVPLFSGHCFSARYN
jgi:hypothetical protein